jgi:competence ComEA-like helix-hairpin-helix protein
MAMKQNIREHLGKRQTWVMVLMILFTCMTLCVDAMAKPQNTKNLNREAAAAFEAGDYDKALAKFNESYAINPKPGLLYNMGRACQAKADHQCAINYYTQFVASPDVDQENLEDALGRIESLQKVIQLTGGKPVVAPAVAAVPAAPAAPAVAAVPAAPAAKKASKGKKEAPKGCVDINTASADQLMALPGVGESTAKKIIDSRASGPFKSVEDIQRVNGIGPAKFNKMKSNICPMDGSAAPVAAPAAPVLPPSAPKKGVPVPPSAGSVDI